MLIYYLLLSYFLISSFIFSSFQPKDRKILQFLTCAIPSTTLLAIRDISVGTDTQQYVDAVTSVKTLGYAEYQSSDLYSNYEVGFRMLMRIAAVSSDPARALIILSSLIIIPIPFYVIYRVSDNPSLGYVVYFLSTIYYFNFTAMRQSLAISFIFLSLLALYKEKRFTPYLFLIIAVCFHTTAFLFLPVLLFIRIKPNASLYFFVPLTAASILFIGRFLPRLFILIPQYHGYLSDSKYLVSGNMMPILQVCFFGILFIVFMLLRHEPIIINGKNVAEHDGYTNLCTAGIISCAVMVIVGASALYVNIFYRFMYEFLPVICLVLPMQLERRKVPGDISIHSVALTTSIAVFFTAFLFVPTTWFGIVPYTIYS